MKRLLAVLLIAILFLFGCGSNESGVEMKKEVASKTFKLYPGAPGGDRGRLLWEATRAMVGPYQADSYSWNTSPTLASWPYVSEDYGAWNALRNSSAYYGYGKTGYYVSCLRNYWEGDLYQPCYLWYGSFDPISWYTSYNETCDQGYRGGQCKAFTNLVAYRSGIYHGSNWAFKALPSDAQVYERSGIKAAKPWNIQAGDVLRMPGGHSAIVARIYDSYNSIVVIDSNWVRLNYPDYGNGCEQVGSHAMSFGGSGVNNLYNYYILDCVYTNNCP